jgi:catechol 2,3-dioxygenase-like lactoylglutathione lyase family enzyme
VQQLRGPLRQTADTHQDRVMKMVSILVLLALSLPAPAQSEPGLGKPDQSVLGSIDHVRILVRDIDKARDAYHKLGFDLAPEPAILPEGSAHEAMWLIGHTYLELIGVADREKLLQQRPWIVEFVEQHQGAHSVGLAVPSAEDLANRLRSRGIDAPVSRLLPKAGAKPFIHVTPKLPHLPDGALFFTQKPPRNVGSAQQADPRQPNSAERILAVWILVKDLKKAGSDIRSVGFHPLRSVSSKALGVKGKEFAANGGSLVLLHAIGSGPASTFARDRPEGVMGVSLMVADLAAARTLVEKNANRNFSTYRGFYGDSFLIPPELASGVWIEMTQEQRAYLKQ